MAVSLRKASPITSISKSSHRRALSSFTDAASSSSSAAPTVKSDDGSSPLLTLPKKMHRRIGSGSIFSREDHLPPKQPNQKEAPPSSSAVSVSSSQFGSVAFLSTPTASSNSVASTSSSNNNDDARLNEKQYKRKRREYATNARYAPLRTAIRELNAAVGPQKRRVALSNASSLLSDADNGTPSLYLGMVDALTVLLGMSDDESETEILSSCLERSFVSSDKDSVMYAHRRVGAALVPLCLRLSERCERRGIQSTISNLSRVLLCMTRISELRTSLALHPGMLEGLERTGNTSAGGLLLLNAENRVLRMRMLANLANSEKNKPVIFERRGLVESVLRVATLDKSESVREYASAVLMDLASCPVNQIGMASMDKVLGTFVKLAIVEEKTETREYAISGLQNLAFEKRNRVQLVTYGKGVVVEALKKTIRTDLNEKTRRRSAGALTNLACDDTAESMGCHDGLLQTLSEVSVSDSNIDVQQRATLALTKLANSVTIEMKCWTQLLDALIDASRCTVADGIVSAMFRVKTRSEENRTSMATHPRLLETLARLCLTAQEHPDRPDCVKDCENATKAIAHLANEPTNHKIICSKHVLSALVYAASLPPSQAVTRDAAILAMERMAMEHSNRPMMARYPGMLVTIAQATEREMKEEASGMQVVSVTGQPRLAKPLLMSLLIAM